MKKYLVLVVTLLSIIIPMKVLALTTDNNPPVLNNISITKTDYNAGEKIYLNLEATDDITGLQYGTITFADINNFYNSFNVAIENIKTEPYVTIPASVITGEYQINIVNLQDGNRNISSYSDNSHLPPGVSSTSENYIQKEFNDVIKITNLERNVVDSTEYGKLVSISFKNSEIKTGTKQTISAIIEANDDIKEVKAIICAYNSCSNNKSKDVILKKSSTSNEYSASFDVSTVNGTYEIYSLSITTVNENTSYYGFKADNPNDGYTIYSDTFHSYYYGSEVTYKIVGGTTDNQGPVLKDIKFNKTKSDAPSRIYAVLDIDEESKLGPSMIYLCKKETVGNKGKSLVVGNINYDEEENLYYAVINLDQYVDTGIYHIAYISLSDEYGNTTNYSVDKNYNYDNKFEDNYELEIIDLINADYTTSTISNNMLNIIKEAKNDDIIMIDGTQSTYIPKSVFEAIQNTNKTIYIEYNGIQWIFNGKDINNPKDIDVEFATELYYDENGEVAGVDLKFASNGELPGKARVRIKAEYTYNYEYYMNNLYAYYYDEENDIYYLVAENLGLSEDGYYEFNITHNSTYKLTNIENKNAKEDEVLKENISSKNKTVAKKDIGKNTIFIIVLSLLLLVILIVLIIIIIKRKKSKVKTTN